MRIVLVMKNWRDSQLQAVRRDDISEGTFEPGAFFEGEIFLEPEDERELRAALLEGFYPEAIINRPPS
jgi:hypothetical protein